MLYNIMPTQHLDARERESRFQENSEKRRRNFQDVADCDDHIATITV